MKLSWSHKLFFKANRLIGRSPAFDALVKFWAEYAVFLFGLMVLMGFWLASVDLVDFLSMIVKTGLVLAVGILLSFTFAWIWPHHRPKAEFPEIKELITPLSHWKSLPSDHSLIAWSLVASFLHFTDLGLHLTIVSVLIAVLICLARVLAGVHYPRDIIAGTLLAGILAYLFFLL